jgi:Na+-translocating ferredoxin:NAD+ oxidoreductase subunit B
MSCIGALFGFILSYANKKLHVPQDKRIAAIMDMLPGANCGACGLPGCAVYAEAIVNKDEAVNLCPVGGAELAQNIAQFMGVEVKEMTAKIARIHCQGGQQVAKNKFRYEGVQSCAAAQQFEGGYKVCEYGCLGFADCLRACPFDAITMDDRRLPVVDPVKCTGCGKCVAACPRDIISLKERHIDVYVMCNNREKAPIMKQGCSVGCIGCKLCEIKACTKVFADNPDVASAIKVDNFLASVNDAVCTNCGKCAEVCPVNVITFPRKEAPTV